MGRFLLSACVVGIAYLAAAICLGLVFGLAGWWPELLFSIFSFNLVMLGALLGVYKILAAVLDDKPLGSVGLAFHSRWKNEIGMGMVLGGAMIFGVAALGRLFGLAQFAWGGGAPAQILSWGIYSLLFFSVSATTEELMFRGYPFQRLVEAIGPAGAVALVSVLFGLAHLGNRSHTWISTLNTMLVGVTLAIAYLRTRALWLPIGIHVSWNFLQGYALGFPVSGTSLPESLARPQVHGAVWLSGGAYGPEGSVISTGVIILATGYVLFSKSIYITEEMRDLVFGSAPTQSGSPEVAAAPADANDGAPTGSPRAH